MKYPCSGCKKPLDHRDFHECASRKRPVASRCRTCRSRDRYGKLWSTTCETCLEPRRLDINGSCSRCNGSQGLKECRGCHQMRLLHLDFYPRRAECIRCKKGDKVGREVGRYVVSAISES